MPVRSDCGFSKVPRKLTATCAEPDEKKSGDTPFSTRRFRSPLMVRFCAPPAPLASEPSITMFVPGPVNRVSLNVISFGLKAISSGVCAFS